MEIFYNIVFITDLHTFTTHRNDNIHCLENIKKKKLLHSTGICLITEKNNSWNPKHFLFNKLLSLYWKMVNHTEFFFWKVKLSDLDTLSRRNQKIRFSFCLTRVMKMVRINCRHCLIILKQSPWLSPFFFIDQHSRCNFIRTNDRLFCRILCALP